MVGLGQNLHTSTLQIVTWGEFRHGTTTECDRGGSRRSRCLQRVQDEQLDPSRWSTWEVERELDLPAVIRRELGQDDETADLAILGGCVVVLSVCHILPRVHVCQMDLLALAVLEPILDSLVDLLLDVLGDGGADSRHMLVKWS